MKLKNILESVAALAVIILCSTLLWQNYLERRPPTLPGRMPSGAAPPKPVVVPKSPVSVTGSSVKGSAKAKLVINEFADFECPYCATFSREIWPNLESKYSDRGGVKLVFSHLPLPNHPFAMKAAQSAECAGQQGHFWLMHDLLFSDQKHLDDASLRSKATALNLDQQAFTACMGLTPEKITADLKQAEQSGVRSTPTFFLGAVQPDGLVRYTASIAGAKSVDSFARVLDNILKYSTQAAGPGQ